MGSANAKNNPYLSGGGGASGSGSQQQYHHMMLGANLNSGGNLNHHPGFLQHVTNQSIVLSSNGVNVSRLGNHHSENSVAS